MSAETMDEMSCNEFVELVTDLIEGRLAEARRVEAEAHLGECEGCAAYLEQIRETIAALRSLAEHPEGTVRTRERALAAFRELRGD